jgi:hypothetical protein
MFGFLRKNPLKSLELEYRRLLEAARDLQRNGDIVGFAAKSKAAEEIAQKIDALRAANR